MIKFFHVSKSFGRDDHALIDINLRLEKGEFAFLTGHSGAGKSTLMKLIFAAESATEGHVVVDGFDLSSLRAAHVSELRRRIGVVFQDYRLLPKKTVFENVAFPLRQSEIVSEKVVDERVMQHLAEVGLPRNVAYKRPAELSGGMRKRVGLARALILKPEVVVYDEPTTGLDPIMSDVINELIIRTRRRNPVTSIVVTHDMNTARKVADRLVMLMPLNRLAPGESQIIFDGTPAELDSTRDRRVQQFINGEACERLMEMRGENPAEATETSHGSPS